jgi:hypothetical protein
MRTHAAAAAAAAAVALLADADLIAKLQPVLGHHHNSGGHFTR